MHVATTTIEKLVDYVINTPEDGFTSFTSSSVVKSIAEKNLAITQKQKVPVTV
jgi:4-O-beta-D-mannosyl-D-glucose phosphorylase